MDYAPRVSVFTKLNGGKSTALNHGINRARGEIVVCLAADTVLEPRTIADLMFLGSLLSVGLTCVEHGPTFAWHTGTQLAAVYLLFVQMDWLAAVIAFLLEPGEERRLTWLMLIQRFADRQIMYWVVVKSFIAAAQGGLVGWGTRERKGTVATQRG